MDGFQWRLIRGTLWRQVGWLVDVCWWQVQLKGRWLGYDVGGLVIERPNVPAKFIATLFNWEVKARRVGRRIVGRLVG